MDVDHETQRLLENWARYRIFGDDDGVGFGCSTLADLESRGRRDEVRIPILAGEGFDVDRTIKTLPTPHERYLVAEYIKTGTQAERARWAGCAVNTYKARVQLAIYAFKSAWYDRFCTKRASHLTNFMA